MRIQFDEQLKALHSELIRMGIFCEKAIKNAIRALREGDLPLAAETVSMDFKTNAMERTIEEKCLHILMRQQPVARDLRQVAATMRIISDLERVGDHAADIGAIVGKIGGRHVKASLPLFPMADIAINMLRESIESYIRRDNSRACAVIAEDDAVDEYFEKMKKHSIDSIMYHPDDGEYIINILMIAKYLERVADHATNIAEWVTFIVKGQYNAEYHMGGGG